MYLRKGSRGFTLIEMMVAVTIFTIVMMVSAGAILSIVEANRKAQSLKSVINNLNFTLETISRNIRVGTNYRCMDLAGSGIPNSNLGIAQDCPNGGNVIAFESQDGNPGTSSDQLVYIFNAGGIFRQIGSGGNTRVRLTSDAVTIDLMRFTVSGVADGDGEQPRVQMVVRGRAQVGGVESVFNLQTSVTQRVLDI